MGVIFYNGKGDIWCSVRVKSTRNDKNDVAVALQSLDENLNFNTIICQQTL